jgi:hypothetical protein
LLEIFEFWIVIGIYENWWEVVGASLPFSNFIFFLYILVFYINESVLTNTNTTFKYSRKFKGARKFVLENPSYIFVFVQAKKSLQKLKNFHHQLLIGDRKCEKFVRKRLLESIILLST